MQTVVFHHICWICYSRKENVYLWMPIFPHSQKQNDGLKLKLLVFNTRSDLVQRHFRGSYRFIFSWGQSNKSLILVIVEMPLRYLGVEQCVQRTTVARIGNISFLQSGIAFFKRTDWGNATCEVSLYRFCHVNFCGLFKHFKRGKSRHWIPPSLHIVPCIICTVSFFFFPQEKIFIQVLFSLVLLPFIVLPQVTAVTCLHADACLQGFSSKTLSVHHKKMRRALSKRYYLLLQQVKAFIAFLQKHIKQAHILKNILGFLLSQKDPLSFGLIKKADIQYSCRYTYTCITHCAN